VNKTTIYLPDDLRDGVKREARRRGVAEAEVIREAIRQLVAKDRPRPRGGFIQGDGSSIAENIDEWMKGFGEN
jgi:metal-responsive CopG/Arc/MetJ family transcriptional regulator